MSVSDRLRATLNAPFRLQDLNDWVKILILFAGLGAAWWQLNYKLDAAAKDARASLDRGERIERYLSSKDAGYWETVKRME